jgi:hypothetical protein
MLARAAALVSQATITRQVRANPCRHFIQMSEEEDDHQISLYWLRQLSLKPLFHKSGLFAPSGLELVCIVRDMQFADQVGYQVFTRRRFFFFKNEYRR